MAQEVAHKALDHAIVLGAATHGPRTRVECAAGHDTGEARQVFAWHPDGIHAAERSIQPCGKRSWQRKPDSYDCAVASSDGGDQHRCVVGLSRDEETACRVSSNDERRFRKRLEDGSFVSATPQVRSWRN